MKMGRSLLGCVLFHDRLDSWKQPLVAASSGTPIGSIALLGVSNIAMVPGGFILRRKSQIIKLHTARNEDVAAWSMALQSIIGTGRSKGNFVPRAATVIPAHRQRQTVCYPRAVFALVGERDGVLINTHRNGDEAATLLGGSAVNFLSHSDSSPNVASHPPDMGKAAGQRSFIPRLEREYALTSKITDDRTFSRKAQGRVTSKVTGMRDLSPKLCRQASVTEKITQPKPLAPSKNG